MREVDKQNGCQRNQGKTSQICSFVSIIFYFEIKAFSFFLWFDVIRFTKWWKFIQIVWRICRSILSSFLFLRFYSFIIIYLTVIFCKSHFSATDIILSWNHSKSLLYFSLSCYFLILPPDFFVFYYDVCIYFYFYFIQFWFHLFFIFLLIFLAVEKLLQEFNAMLLGPRKK